VEKFSVLVDQLTAHEVETNPLYYAMRFVDGLKDDVKSMVMIQRPITLDDACGLALVQEEVVEFGRKKGYGCLDSTSNRMSQRHASSYSLPKWDKPVGQSAIEEVHQTKSAKVGSIDDKFRALKQYHHAKGLCDRCAEKCSYGHKCASTV
jgi:hypothetical protein